MAGPFLSRISRTKIIWELIGIWRRRYDSFLALKNGPHSRFKQKSTCVNHNAVNSADKEVKGRAVTGGGTADCARHGLKRPNGFGDLQKGER